MARRELKESEKSVLRDAERERGTGELEQALAGRYFVCRDLLQLGALRERGGRYYATPVGRHSLSSGSINMSNR